MRTIVDVIKEEICDGEDIRFYEGYSGRGMFGRKCIGVVCYDPLRTIVNICDAVRNEGYDDCSDLEDIRMDSMGYDSIVYFPSIEG